MTTPSGAVTATDSIRLAAVDIGSNSVHLLVADVGRDRSLSVVDRLKDMIKLGAGTFQSHCLSEDALERGVDAVSRFCEIADGHGAEAILAVATSATREAKNAGEFLNAIRRRTGVSTRLVSGSEEGRLIYRAVHNDLDLGDGSRAIIDIGGGSVELVVGSGAEVFQSESLRLGVQRLLGEHGDAGKLTDKAQAKLRARIRGVASGAIERASSFAPSTIIGTSGSIRALARLAEVEVLTRKQVEKLADELCSKDPEQRAKLGGIDERRADSIHFGALVLAELMELLGASELRVCDASLREGILLDYLDRYHPQSPAAQATSIRRRGIDHLRRGYQPDGGLRAEHVATIALTLFDELRAAHELDERHRELLEYASLLHDIGQYVSFRRHHKHGRYIIKHAALRGFEADEIQLLAHIVRYQRKKEPRPRAKSLRKLTRHQRNDVIALASLLRIAVAFDRGHDQQVGAVSATIADDEVTITVDGRDDLALEVWAARRKTGPLARVLGRHVRLERAPREISSAA